MNEFKNVLKSAKSKYTTPLSASLIFLGAGALMWWGFEIIWFFIGLGTIGLGYAAMFSYYTYKYNVKIMSIEQLAKEDPQGTIVSVSRWTEDLKNQYLSEVERSKKTSGRGRGRRQAITNAKYLKKRYEALTRVIVFIEQNLK